MLQKNLRDTEEKITHTIEETKSSLLENTSSSCQSVRDYCKENIIDVNNNLVDFKVNMNIITSKIIISTKDSSKTQNIINNGTINAKDAVRETNGKVNKKISGCGKNLEMCRF